MRLTTRPIEAWPGDLTPEGRRQVAQFSASWSDTQLLLEREVRFLTEGDQRHVVLQLAITDRDVRNDGWIRADARPEHPGVIVSFDSLHGPLRYSTDRFSHASFSVRKGQPGSCRWTTERIPGWQCNVRAIALGLEALRKIDRYGIASGGEQYHGWRALGAGTPMPAAQMTVDEAARLLCDATMTTIGEDASDIARVSVLAMSLWREAAKVHHPDAGGDPEMFRRLTEARDVLIKAGA